MVCGLTGHGAPLTNASGGVNRQLFARFRGGRKGPEVLLPQAEFPCEGGNSGDDTTQGRRDADWRGVADGIGEATAAR